VGVAAEAPSWSGERPLIAESTFCLSLDRRAKTAEVENLGDNNVCCADTAGLANGFGVNDNSIRDAELARVRAT